MSDWQPQAYLNFADERTRAARELLAEVPLVSPVNVFLITHLAQPLDFWYK